MAALSQKQKLQIWPQPRVPKMAKYGQKSCLAWFYTYIRGFNRFLVPKNIGKDILHDCIASKQKIVILVAPRVPKMANYGQKSCLALF